VHAEAARIAREVIDLSGVPSSPDAADEVVGDLLFADMLPSRRSLAAHISAA
jgi:hypothetical protein